MAIRVPPGRAGRLWLLRRLEVARRGAEVLEQKRGTLLRERLRLASQLAEATANWERTSRAASAWNARVSAAAGPRVIRLAALDTGKATVTISWRNVLGVVVPVSAEVEDGGVPSVGVARGAAVALATEAHAEALSAAASLAALSAAHEAIEAELRRTIRRLRAIEQRWIPAHEAELRRLELVLEENELADIVRVRWAVSRQR
jgi:V/A-type H+-transporting ATPase subunit D